MKKFFVSLAFCLVSLMTLSAQQMPPIPVDPAVRIGKLDNGLTYYIRHNEYPKDQANFYIAQKVGSILEEENQRGLAHFLEHMCFNGTKTFPGNSLIKYLESIGVKFGADLNAYTSIDETVYNIDAVPVQVAGAIDSCLWILHDWADGLLLNGEDIDNERGVIHEEWRTRQNATMRLYEKLLPVIYPGNRYAERMPIGLMEVVDNFPYQAIRDYYEKWYRPDQQGIVVVGDIDVDAIEAKIKDIFGTIATPVNPAERFYVPVEDNAEPIIAMATDKEQAYPITYIFKKHEAYPNELKGDLNYLVYQYALGMMQQMASARFEEMMVSPDCPFAMAAIQDDDYFISKTKKSVLGIAATKDGEYADGVAAVYREMLRIARHGFTATEYDRARSEYLTHVESAYNERDKRRSADFCREYVRHFIDAEPIMGIENEYAIANQLCPNIPVEVINAVVAQLFTPGNLVVMSMLPEREGGYPSEEEVKAILAAVEAEDIAPYEDKVNDEPLISELPATGKIVKTKAAKFGYTMYKLSNGATVYVRPTDFKADEIIMRGFSDGGISLYNTSEGFNLLAVDDVVGVGGLGNFSVPELSKALSGKKVSVNRYISTYEEGINGSTTPKDFETMLQLTYLSFTAERRDDDAFKSFQNRTKAMLANAELNPMSALRDTISSTLYANHPLSKNMKAADVDGLSYDRMLQIISERFSGAADFTFVFTGAIDMESALPLIEKYIGAIPAGVKKEKWHDVGMNLPKGIKNNTFNRPMETPKATVLMIENSKTKTGIKDQIVSSILSQTLDMLFTEEIREKEGGTYGVSVMCNLGSTPKKQAVLQVVYETDPDKYEYLNGRIRSLLVEFAQKGPSAEDLTKAKEYMQKKYGENQKENGYFSGRLKTWLKDGLDMDTDYEKVLASVTGADVAKALADIMKAGNSAAVIMVGTAQ